MFKILSMKDFSDRLNNLYRVLLRIYHYITFFVFISTYCVHKLICFPLILGKVIDLLSKIKDNNQTDEEISKNWEKNIIRFQTQLVLSSNKYKK